MNTWVKQNNKQKTNGFTIVELLIVIVVIAILATISIVAYNGIQDRAADAVIKADLSNIVKKLELVRVDLGRYPQTLGEMPDYKLSKNSYDQDLNNAYYCLDLVEQKYAFGARSKSKKGFIQTTDGLQEGGSVSGSHTCQAIGKASWSDTGLYTVQGYSASGYPDYNGWAPGWKWTK